MEAEGRTILKVRLDGQEVMSEQGELEAYVVITEDVTNQRQLEIVCANRRLATR